MKTYQDYVNRAPGSYRQSLMHAAGIYATAGDKSPLMALRATLSPIFDQYRVDNTIGFIDAEQGRSKRLVSRIWLTQTPAILVSADEKSIFYATDPWLEKDMIGTTVPYVVDQNVNDDHAGGWFYFRDRWEGVQHQLFGGPEYRSPYQVAYDLGMPQDHIEEHFKLGGLPR